MDAPLISVIVPVYKVEAYLDRCVQSIVDQSYQNLEIILVDDGSPDNCPAMCDAWAEKDKRIKVIHKDNGGLSDARNAGLLVASGEYIGFVDSDDYISSEMYQLLYENLLANNSDVAACGVEMIFEDGSSSRLLTRSGSCVMESDAAMEAVVLESWLKQPVWYKLYKADLIRNLRFPVGKYHEDVFWTWRVISKAKKVSVFDTPCYFYVQRSGSIMSEKYSLRRIDAIDAKLERSKFLEIEFPQLVDKAKIDLLYSCIYHGQLAQRDLETLENNKIFSKLQSIIKSTGVSFQGLTLKHRCWLMMARISLIFTCKLRNLLGVGL